MNCSFILKNGKQCNNEKLEGTDFCYISSHFPSESDYDSFYNQCFNLFLEERYLLSNYKLREVDGDGACLFRCLSNAIFIKSKRDLNIMIEKFNKTGYFNNPKFLDDYIEIADCFTADDYVLDNDLEEEIARGIQLMILNFIKANSKMKIMLDMSLEDLIQLCHEMDIQKYLELYARFAGDDDFIIDSSNNDGEENKVDIDVRWGGIPEIKVFCLLFNINIMIYTTQEFNKKTMRASNTSKISKNTYVKLVDKIESAEIEPTEFKLLLRYYEKGSHYDYLE